MLVVDDDDLIRARLSTVLKSSRYEVEVAASGEEALRVMNAKHCHMVLTDWEMPDMDGLSLCRCVRASQEEGYVYVLMLTVRNSKEDVVAGLAAGADDYIVKGSPVAEILARLEVGRRIVRVDRSPRVKLRNHHLSLADSVTGAHNLRYFAKQLAREPARSRRYGLPLAVLDCRIDELSRIRDELGHEAAAPHGANRVVDKLSEVFAADVVTSSGPLEFRASFAAITADPNKRPLSAERIEELIRSASGDAHAKSATAEHLIGDEPTVRSELRLQGRGRSGMN